jgi:pseudaminic acid cytidylyltransferase
MKPVAIIPARGGSKRIPRKNIVDVCGTPMIGHTITNALASNVFSHVIVSTEDDEIKQIAESFGAVVIDRPVELSTDTAFEIDVYGQALDGFAAQYGIIPEYFCGIYATAIFVDKQDFEHSYAMIKETQDINVLMSVSEYPIHPYKALSANGDGFLEMVHPKECLMRSQTFPKYVASNGTFYWLKTAEYRKLKSYYTDKLSGYTLANEKAVDIDVPDDLEWAIKLMTIKQDEI